MDLFEVLVHVMVNLVLLKLNRSGLICMEVGVRRWGERQSYCVRVGHLWQDITSVSLHLSPLLPSRPTQSLCFYEVLVSRGLHIGHNKKILFCPGSKDSRVSGSLSLTVSQSVILQKCPQRCGHISKSWRNFAGKTVSYKSFQIKL